jgi:hypothetical protein
MILIDGENENCLNEYNMENEILNENFQIKQSTTKRKITRNLKNDNTNKLSKIACSKEIWKGHNKNATFWVFHYVNDANHVDGGNH